MDEEIKKYLGLKVRFLRENAKISQEELANSCDVSWRTISNLERGCVVPDLKMVYNIARFFGVGLDELFDIKIQPKKSVARIFAENQLIERVRAMDDRMLAFVAEQVDVAFKHFKD